ncbi:MAG: hypothetical protein ACTS42_01605 [Candidatus Hodgkinia cicadicola]
MNLMAVECVWINLTASPPPKLAKQSLSPFEIRWEVIFQMNSSKQPRSLQVSRKRSGDRFRRG